MKQLMTILLFFVLSACANQPPKPPNYFENKHYSILSNPKSDKPIVTEYFSFYSINSSIFEPSSVSLQKHLLGEAKYEKIPVFENDIELKITQSIAKAHATMLLINKENQLLLPMFELVQSPNSPKNDEDIRNFFINQGIDGSLFDEIYNSDKAKQLVNIYQKKADTESIDDIPMIIVNNKYKVINSSFYELNQDDRNELIDYLLTQ